MSAKGPVRKRSVTLNTLDPFYGQDRRKRQLKTSSINSLASGIAYFTDTSRPRSCTWHGPANELGDIETGEGPSETIAGEPHSTDIAQLKDFDDEFESQEFLRQIISEELDRFLRDFDYDTDKSVKQGSLISQAVEGRVRNITKPGSKIVAVVYIGEIRDQGIEITSQCLWDPDADNFATASFRNKTLFAICTVFIVV